MTKNQLDKINKTIRHSRSKPWASGALLDMRFAALQGRRRSAVRFKTELWIKEYLHAKATLLTGPIGILP